MAPKKAGAKKRKATVKPATDVRMETLRLFEATAESILMQEVQRREREEQEEQLMVLRDEHDGQVAVLERTIDTLRAKLAEAESRLQTQQREHETVLATMRVQCDSLTAQVQTITSERDDIKAIMTRDREQHVADTTKFRAQIESLNVRYEQERAAMREHVTAANTLVEQHHRTVVSSTETQVTSERQNQVVTDSLKKELDAALTLNTTLQKAIEKAEETDRTNAALQQFLAAQLEEAKRSYEAEIEESRQQLAASRAEVEQLSVKCRTLEHQIVVAAAEKTEAVEGTAVELRECQQLLEQVKFDTAYLNNEIATMRREYSTRMGAAEASRREAQVIARQNAVEAEAARMKMAEMEVLLYRREKEHFDEVTALRAQTVDMKTALAKTRHDIIVSELTTNDGDVNSRVGELQHVYESREKRLMEDICSLRTAILDMQQHLAAKEVEMLMDQKHSSEEIAQLQRQLAAQGSTEPSTGSASSAHATQYVL